MGWGLGGGEEGLNIKENMEKTHRHRQHCVNCRGKGLGSREVVEDIVGLNGGRRRPDLGSPYNIQLMYCGIVYLKPVCFTNHVTPVNSIKK